MDSCRLSGSPPTPLLFRQPDGEALRALPDLSDERHSQHQRLLDELVEPALIRERRVAESELRVRPRLTIEDRVEPQPIGKATQFGQRCRLLGQVDEVRLDTALGEEPESLPGIRAFLHAKDLYFHRLACVRSASNRRRRPTVSKFRFVSVGPREHTYRPAWWVPGPHAQTLWGKFARRPAALPTRVERWPTPDGDFLDILRLDAAPASPRLFLLHGLEGTVRSHYVSGLLSVARERGWGADMLIFRGCGDEPNRARRFYHSGETTDLAFAIDHVAREFPV